MALFTRCYEKVIAWAAHPRASYYLAGLSASEAVFFPIPPDIMLAPMVLSNPDYAWRYAAVTTFSSIFGGLIGYFIGMFLFSIAQGYLQYMGYQEAYQQAQQWFLAWGFLAVTVAAFTPLPYKLFTIAAGASGMPLLPFVLGSIVGRGARFYLVSALMRWGGRSMERVLLRYIEWLGWLIVILLLAYMGWRLFFS